MAKPAQIVDAKRVSEIADAIFATVSPLGGLQNDVASAQEALTGASAARDGGREGMIVTLARLADLNGWTETEVAAAAARVVKMANNVTAEKAIATFSADMKAAMHPKVRQHVPDFVTIRDAVWAEEALLPKECAKPARKAFVRAYHMLKSMMVTAREDGRLILSVSDAQDWAIERDPDMDPKRVMGRLEAIRAQLAAFAADFPVEGLTSVDEFLGEITEATLKAARAQVVAAQEDVLQSHRLAPIVATPAPVAVVPTTVVQPIIADPVAAYLDDLEASLAA